MLLQKLTTGWVCDQIHSHFPYFFHLKTTQIQAGKLFTSTVVEGIADWGRVGTRWYSRPAESSSLMSHVSFTHMSFRFLGVHSLFPAPAHVVHLLRNSTLEWLGQALQSDSPGFKSQLSQWYGLWLWTIYFLISLHFGVVTCKTGTSTSIPELVVESVEISRRVVGAKLNGSQIQR